MKVMPRYKIVDLPGISTCRATLFECVRHIDLILRQGATDPRMTSKSCSLLYFEQGAFQYIAL